MVSVESNNANDSRDGNDYDVADNTRVKIMVGIMGMMMIPVLRGKNMLLRA